MTAMTVEHQLKALKSRDLLAGKEIILVRDYSQKLIVNHATIEQVFPYNHITKRKLLSLRGQ